MTRPIIPVAFYADTRFTSNTEVVKGDTHPVVVEQIAIKDFRPKPAVPSVTASAPPVFAEAVEAAAVDDPKASSATGSASRSPVVDQDSLRGEGDSGASVVKESPDQISPPDSSLPVVPMMTGSVVQPA